MAVRGPEGQSESVAAASAAGAPDKLDLITVGEVVGAYGIKGWVKIKSHTQPQANILRYSPWWLQTRHGVKQIEIDESQDRAQGPVVHIRGLDDRDAAAALRGVKVSVPRSQLPELEPGDYYWHQLVGLKVISTWQGGEVELGQVQSLLETGANDVLVVRGDSASLDQRERLIPYLPGRVVSEVDLDAGVLKVDWDPEF